MREVLDTGVGSAVMLQFDIEPNIWPVMVDVAEFETALVNLVINARDAMPDGGVIAISARNDRLDDGANAGEYVAISVEDTGIGIAPDILSRIFDPFFTTKPIGKGTGLGLSQVHGFTHQAGGTVRVESKSARGPSSRCCCRARKSRPSTEKARAAETGGSGTVLLVEDNPDVATVSTNLLEQLGYTVRQASDAETALREIKLDGIDFVFSDVVMPGKMDGLASRASLESGTARSADPAGQPATAMPRRTCAVIFQFSANPTKFISSARRSRNCRGEAVKEGCRTGRSPHPSGSLPRETRPEPYPVVFPIVLLTSWVPIAR